MRTDRRGAAIVLAVVLLTGAAGVVWWRWGGSPVDRELERAEQPRELRDRIAAERLATGESDEAIGHRLTRAGIARLDDETLLTRARVFSRMLAAMPVENCAAACRGFGPPRLATDALNRLGEDDARAWARLATAAMIAEVHGAPLIPRPSDAEANAVVEAWAAPMSAAERARFVRAMKNLGSVSDDDACWAIRTQYTRSLALPAAERTLALRLLIVH